MTKEEERKNFKKIVKQNKRKKRGKRTYKIIKKKN